MATFFAAMIGFVVALFVTVSPAEAQHRSDPGEPVRFRRLAEDGSTRYQTGENTGYHRLLAFVNADRPAGQQLDEAAFDAANRCRVIYVCERPGRPLRVDRNGSCPELNGTSRVVDYETFCLRGERSRWTVDGKVYFAPAIVTTEPVVTTPPPIPEQRPEVMQPQATPTSAVVPQTGTAQPRTSPQPRPQRTTSAQAVHEEESTVRSVLFVLALLFVGAFVGWLITYLVMRNKRVEDPSIMGMEESRKALEGEKQRHAAELQAREDVYKEELKRLSRTPNKQRIEDELRKDYAERVTELETEVRDRRNFEDHILTMLGDLVPELEQSLRETRKMERFDEMDGSQRRPSLNDRETFCERKLRRLVAIQGVLAMALGQAAEARKNLMVARGLGYVSLDSARANGRPWFRLLVSQLLLGMEGRIQRLRNDIRELNAIQSVRPPPNGRPSMTTIGPPRLGGTPSGNGQPLPTAPDTGMGPDPFRPPPPKID